MACRSSASNEDTNSPPKFLSVDPQKGSNRDIANYLIAKNVMSGMNVLDGSDEEINGGAVVDHRWILSVSIIIRRILNLLDYPVKHTGYAVEFIFNLLSQNGGVFGALHNFLFGDLKIPQRDSQDFISYFGHVDGRIELYKPSILSEQGDNSNASDVANIEADLGNKYKMDLCVMSAKLIHENPKVIQNVVDNYWKMHFVEFYECWNESLKQNNTKVFICCDKPKDANIIVVSFRGTDTFSVHDMSTDFDFSWYEIPKVGKVHIGFLEAMGLGTHNEPTTFQNHLSKNSTDVFHLQGESKTKINELAKTRAYYAVALKLKDLLNEHKDAKFVVTGHSLGAALAILFACVLVIQEETEMLERLLNVYTFGQPRIGDAKFATFMESRLNFPTTRYFRVVYCNDLIPRIPFDDSLFSFKHFGRCIYYDSCYFGKIMDEEPNKNYFSPWHLVKMWPNAQWELFRSMIMSYTHGAEYKETWVMAVLRLIALLVPCFSCHSPVEYINCVRLGREKSTTSFASLKSFVLEP